MNTYLNSRPILKSCDNCYYRQGNDFFAKCGLSGYYCTTERHNPDRCGLRFENWIARPKRRSLRRWLLDLLWT